MAHTIVAAVNKLSIAFQQSALVSVIWATISRHYGKKSLAAFIINPIDKLTLMLEKIVPLSTINIRGSILTILLGEARTQMVLMMNSESREIIGRIASPNGRILPVLSRYDLKIT